MVNISSLDDRNIYVKRTLFQDFFQTFLNKFIDYAMTRETITEDDLLNLQSQDMTQSVYEQWCE